MAAPSRTVKVKFDGDTTGLAVAAKQGERIVDRFADNTARTFTSRFRSWFTGQGADDANSVGRFFARTFGTGLLSGFTVPMFGPALIAVLLGVVAVAAPVIGAALAVGIVAAFGAGLVGLGVVFAAQAEQVKSAFSNLTADLGSRMRFLAAPFEDTLVQIAGFMRRTFEAFAPILRSVFAALAPIVTAFADQFFKAFEEFRPAIDAIGKAFGDLLTSLGPKLGPLFADIADTITGIAETISKNKENFASLITFFVNLADVAAETIGVLASFFGLLSRSAQGLNEVEGSFESVNRQGQGFAQTLDGFGRVIATTAPALASTRDEADRLGWQVQSTAEKFDAARASFEAATLALSDYAAAQQAATDPVFALINAVTTADQAQTAYNEAVKQYGVDSAEASAAAVTAAQSVASLEQAALNGDVSFSAFNRKLRQWVESGKITAGQAETIRTKVAEARGEAEDFTGNYEATITARDKATTVLQGIRAWLAMIQSKTVTITARTQIPAGVSVRQLMERQHGGPVVSGRSYLVGEKGPEILTMGRESGNIIPNSQIDRVGGGNGSGGWDERTLTRALHDAIDGARLVIDDRGLGRLISRQADLYGRAG